jgi:hypothetical protein
MPSATKMEPTPYPCRAPPAATYYRRVSCPPQFPANAQRATIPSMAADGDGNVVVSWQGNVNDPEPLNVVPLWSAFARSFRPNPTSPCGAKNDFRVDLGGRTVAYAPRVAQARQQCVEGANQNQPCLTDADCPSSTCDSTGRFPFVWRDARSGQFSVYTRIVPSL